MFEMHLQQPGFIYNSCRPFTKNKVRMQKFKETGDSGYIYQNELNKVRFQHNIAYWDSKDLITTASDKILCDEACDIVKKVMDIKEALLPWLTNILIKRLLVVVYVNKKKKIC